MCMQGASSAPRLLEPEKCHEWRWVPYSEIPQPRFTPLQKFLDHGPDPSADVASMNVRLADGVVSEGGGGGGLLSPALSRGADMFGDVRGGGGGPGIVLADAVMPSGAGGVPRSRDSFASTRPVMIGSSSAQSLGEDYVAAQPGSVSLAPPVMPAGAQYLGPPGSIGEPRQ